MKKINQLINIVRRDSIDVDSHGNKESPRSLRTVANNKARKRKTNFSSFEGGSAGRCSQCNLNLRACRCQHCFICGSYMWTLQSRHHCRRCWRACCTACSSKRRHNDFLADVTTRTCNECAPPTGLLLASRVADTYKLREAVSVIENDTKCSENMLQDTFRWGIYALTCALDAPRRCVNPSCSLVFEYGSSCTQCQVPTVPTKPHEVRGFKTLALSPDPKASGNTKASSKSSIATNVTAVTEVTESLVAEKRNRVLDAMSTEDANSLFDLYLPNHADTFAIQGLRENSWDTRKILLSSIAVGIATEGTSAPNISLALSDDPMAQLLRVVRVEKKFSIFESPGRVRYVAFATIHNRQELQKGFNPNDMVAREVWSCDDTSKLGVVVHQHSVRDELLEQIGSFKAQAWALEEVESSTVMHDVKNDVVQMTSEGYDVVLCGHSLGGAIASLMSSILFIEHTKMVEARLLCVTFGAPLVANRGMSDVLDTLPDLRSRFQHFVQGSDMVPRLHYLGAFLESGSMSVARPSAAGKNDEEDYVMSSSSPVETRIMDVVVGWCANQLCPEVRARLAESAMKEDTKRSKRESSSDSDNDTDERENATLAQTASGDIFFRDREPFTNNLVSQEWSDGTNSYLDSFQHFSFGAFREHSSADPYGCFNFLWRGTDIYIFSDDSASIIGVLCDRGPLRVQLVDHLLSSYVCGLQEYLHSIPNAD